MPIPGRCKTTNRPNTKKPPTMATPAATQKTVLITGCSDGGIGAALAHAFHHNNNNNYRVFATARSLAKLPELAALPNVEPVQLDVTSPSSIASALGEITKRANGRLDVLVNNAGVTYMTPALDSEMQASMQMMDANFWGMVRVTQAFGPLVVAAKGAIVNVGSINSKLYPPYQSVYNATKAANELWSETLRIEMDPLGVRVLTVMTGVVATRILTNSPVPKLPDGSFYKTAEEKLVERAAGATLGNMPVPAERFAEEIVGDVIAGRSGRIWRGGLSGTVKWLHAWLPMWVLVSCGRETA